jgi:hypothetical protein
LRRVAARAVVFAVTAVAIWTSQPKSGYQRHARGDYSEIATPRRHAGGLAFLVNDQG